MRSPPCRPTPLHCELAAELLGLDLRARDRGPLQVVDERRGHAVDDLAHVPDARSSVGKV